MAIESCSLWPFLLFFLDTLQAQSGNGFHFFQILPFPKPPKDVRVQDELHWQRGWCSRENSEHILKYPNISQDKDLVQCEYNNPKQSPLARKNCLRITFTHNYFAVWYSTASACVWNMQGATGQTSTSIQKITQLWSRSMPIFIVASGLRWHKGAIDIRG